MRWHVAVVLGLSLACSARGSGDEPPARTVVVGKHVEASGDVPAEVLEEAARLGDQLVPLLAAHFEAEVPKDARPLRVVIHATQEGFRQAVRAEGGIPQDLQNAGGFTPRKTLVSHLWLQEEPFETRRLVLHEITRQVQEKTFADAGPGTDTEWHREGLAAHFSWHLRGRDGLVVGQVDAIARNETTWQIANDIAHRRVDPLAHVLQVAPHGTAESLALVHALLVTKDTVLRERFRKWEREAWRSTVAGARFAKEFGLRAKEVREALEEIWRWRAWPWEIRLGRWDEDAGRIRGTAEGLGVLVRGRFVDSALTAVQPLPRPTRARLLGGGTGTAGIQVGLGTGTLQSVVGFGERLLRLERTADTICLRLLTAHDMQILKTWRLPLERSADAWVLELAPRADGIQATVTGEPPEGEFVPLETLFLEHPGRPGGGPPPASAALRETWSRTWFHGALYVRGGQCVFDSVTLSR